MKTALVTGGSRGIGLMIVEGLVECGYKVYIVARKSHEAQQSADELNRQHGASCVIPIVADVSKKEEIERVIKIIDSQERDMGLNVLVNNAGTNYSAPLPEHSWEAFQKVIQLNLVSAFYLIQQAEPLLRRAQAKTGSVSRIINIGSINGVRAPTELPTYGYASSKAALHHLTQHLAAHLAPQITVNAIAPGAFPSKMMQKTLDDFGDEIKESTPMKRIGRKNDIASLCKWLVSDGGDYVTGSVIVIDGGAVIVKGKL